MDWMHSYSKRSLFSLYRSFYVAGWYVHQPIENFLVKLLDIHARRRQAIICTWIVMRLSFRPSTSCIKAWYVHEWLNIGVRSILRSKIMRTWTSVHVLVATENPSNFPKDTWSLHSCSAAAIREKVWAWIREIISQFAIKLICNHFRCISSRTSNNGDST